MYRTGLDTESQLCVYVGDKKVIDIWGASPSKGMVYTPDTTCSLFSAGKTVAAICMAIMKDKGLLSYEEKVCTYWPEFAQNGKENITVADVLRHEAGLEKFEETIQKEWTQTENVKKNMIGAVIEKTTPFWRKDSKRVYHAITRDWINNEIFRRVEPSGRTMGEYFKQELEKKYNMDVYIRMDEADLVKSADYKWISIYK